MAQIELHHDEISAALQGHRAHHENALGQLQAPTETDGVPAVHMAAVQALLAHGRALHDACASRGVAGEAARRNLEGTDESNAGKFKGGS